MTCITVMHKTDLYNAGRKLLTLWETSPSKKAFKAGPMKLFQGAISDETSPI